MAAVQEFEQYPGHGAQGVFHLTSEVVTFVLVQVGEGGHGGRVAGPLQQGGAVDLFPGTAPETYGHGDGQGLCEFEDTGAQLERVGGPNAEQSVGEPAQPACVQPGGDAGELEFGAEQDPGVESDVLLPQETTHQALPQVGRVQWGEHDHVVDVVVLLAQGVHQGQDAVGAHHAHGPLFAFLLARVDVDGQALGPFPVRVRGQGQGGGAG